MANNFPIFKNRYRNISIAVFKEESADRNGELRTSFSCSLQRSYKDKDGKWQQSTLSCFLEDLLPISSLAENMFQEINKHLNELTAKDKNYSSAPQGSSNLDADIPF